METSEGKTQPGSAAIVPCRALHEAQPEKLPAPLALRLYLEPQRAKSQHFSGMLYDLCIIFNLGSVMTPLPAE